jgi:hypothetical protein
VSIGPLGNPPTSNFESLSFADSGVQATENGAPATWGSSYTAAIDGGTQQSGGTPNQPHEPPPMPDLQMDVLAPPSWDPTPINGTGTGNPPPPAENYSIDLGQFRSAIQNGISGLLQVADDYEAAKITFNQGKDVVYGQYMLDESTSEADTSSSLGNPADTEGTQPTGTVQMVYTADPIATMAQAFAYGATGVPSAKGPINVLGMNDQIAYAFERTAGLVEVVGQFLALMNAAGFTYAQADVSSALPSAVTTESGK